MQNSRLFNSFILDDNEEVIEIIRQAKGGLINIIFLGSLLIILPFFFLFNLFYWGTIGISVFFISIMVGVFIIIRKIFIWYFKSLVITTIRIIDIDQQSLFSRIVSEIPLDKIQDVFYRIKGVRQTVSRIGDIQITLMKDKTKIVVQNVSRPQKIQQLILQLRKNFTETKNQEKDLSAKELLGLVKKIKSNIGENKFKELIEDDK